MDLSPNQMLRLAPNKVDYLIPGGEMINEFSGGGPGGAGVFPDVDRLPGDLRAPARHCHGAVQGGGDGRFSAGLPGEKPCGLAGRGSRRALGGQPGLSAQTAPLQGPPAAPDPSGRGRGRGSIFGLPSGKDEAWYVLDTRPGACIWLGFRPGVTPAYFRELIERQDTAALLDCLHQIPDPSGGGVLHPGGHGPRHGERFPGGRAAGAGGHHPAGGVHPPGRLPPAGGEHVWPPPAWTACWTASILTACPGRSCWPGTGSAPPPGGRALAEAAHHAGARPPGFSYG